MRPAAGPRPPPGGASFPGSGRGATMALTAIPSANFLFILGIDFVSSDERSFDQLSFVDNRRMHPHSATDF